MPNQIVRLATEEDRESIIRLTLDMFLSCEASTTVLWAPTESNAVNFYELIVVPAIKNNDPVVVVVIDSAIVGLSVWATIVSPYFTFRKKYAFGYFTFVDYKHRGKGISKVLRDKAIDIAKDIGVQQVIGSVDSRNSVGAASTNRYKFKKMAETFVLDIE